MSDFISFAEYHIKNTDSDFLEKYWDWERNELNPYKIRHSSGKKIWIKCQNKDYHGSYEIQCNHFKNGKRCPYCANQKIHPLDSFAQYHINNTDKDFLEKYWDYDKNDVNPYEVSPSGNSDVWIKCQNKSYHGSYKVTRNHFTGRNSRCPYCHNGVHYFDSLGFLYYDIAKMIVEDERNGLTWEDTYLIAPNSNQYFYFKCLNCNSKSKKKKKLSNIQNFGFSCELCSDGISIPEKFMSNVLSQLNINFITQYKPDWSNDKKYDFYVPSLNMIIEVHGLQHYKECQRGRSLKEEEENDIYKKILALDNNIKNYIIVNCSESTLEWLKFNVVKELNNILNLNNIDWNKIWKNCQNSLIIKAWDLWDKGLSVKEISDVLKLSRKTVCEYLKRGGECEKCNYTKEVARKRAWINASDEEKERISKKKSESLKGKYKGVNGNTSKLYKIIDLEGNEQILCGNKIYNSNKQIGFLNITIGTFNKYIRPYGNIDISRIENTFRSRKIIEKLKLFDGWIIEEIKD